MGYEDVFLREPPFTRTILFQRSVRGVETNVPHLVTEHSPTGYEFGYGGSGPADLALNILENALRAMQYKGKCVSCWKGKCFALAYEVHQTFKWEFISGATETSHCIPFEVVAAWLKERM